MKREWTDRDEQRLLADINGDDTNPPPSWWIVLLLCSLGVVVWVALVIVKLWAVQ